MKRIILILIAAVFAMNGFAQLSFEKMYQASEAIVPLDGDFFAVKKDGKWGVMKNNMQILDYFYDSIDVLSDGIITYIKNDQAGFADTLGNVITLADYLQETPYNRADESILNVFQSGSALVYDGKKLILLGKDGKQINDDSKEIISKADNTVIFKQDGAYGMMDAAGNVIAPNKYRRIQSVIIGELYAYTAQKNGIDYLGFISADGKVLSPAEYDDMTIINKNDKFYVKAFTSAGKQALYDSKGNQLFSPLYQNIEPLNNGNYYIYTDNGRKGIVGTNYITYIPAAYDDLLLKVLAKDTFFIAKNDDKTYILNTKNTTIDVTSGNIKDFVSFKNNELIYIADSLLNYGVRSSKKGWMIQPQYLDIFAESKGNFVVRKKDKWGAVDINNNVTVAFDYKKVRASQAKTCIVFYEGKKNSVLLKDNGQKIEFPKTDNVLPMPNYVEYKLKGNRVRLYLDGTELKNNFLLLGTNKDGILCVQMKKGWTYVDSKTYEPLTDQYFDYVTGFNGNQAYVVQDKKLYIIDKNFNKTEMLIDDKYKNLDSVAGLLSLGKNIKKNYIILKGYDGTVALLKINK